MSAFHLTGGRGYFHLYHSQRHGQPVIKHVAFNKAGDDSIVHIMPMDKAALTELIKAARTLRSTLA